MKRLTLAFSKTLANFEAAIGLHFASRNFVERHNTLRMTPAMALGLKTTSGRMLTSWSVPDDRLYCQTPEGDS